MLSEHVCLDSICPVIGEGVTISGISFDNPGLVAGAGCSHCSQGGVVERVKSNTIVSPCLQQQLPGAGCRHGPSQ